MIELATPEDHAQHDTQMCPRCQTLYYGPTAGDCDWCPGTRLVPYGCEVHGHPHPCEDCAAELHAEARK